MKKLANFVTKYPKSIIIMVLILTIIFGYYATKVTMTTNIKDFFPENDPRVITYNQVEDLFGGAEYIMVAITSDDIFTYSTLNKIAQLTNELESLEGVSSVKSLTSIDEIKGSEWGLEISPLISDIPKTNEEINDLKEKVLNDEMYGGVIVSKDGKAALNIIEVSPEVDSIEIANEISEIIKKYDNGNEKVITQ